MGQTKHAYALQHKNSAFMDGFISSVDKIKSRKDLATQNQICD